MPNQEKDFSIHLNSLLQTYSVEDITSLFTEIDKRLISLHSKSAEDFLKLNASYKDIYIQSNLIKENINSICSSENIQRNNSLYQLISNLYEKLKVQFEILDYRITVITDQLEKLSNHIRHIFFPIKSYSQNLMSLNYLIANLKISLSYSKDLNNGNLDDFFNETEKLIESVKNITDSITNSLNKLSKVSKNSQNTIKELNGLNELNLESLLKEIQTTIELVNKKNEDNQKIVPKINDKIEDLQISNTEIIKKLQYQDIIRQKMEHIQNTHKDLISELAEFNDAESDGKNLNEQVKCFLRIRDISGLQAAQLIQANKEYQSAIEVIIDNFILIGDTLQDITEDSQNVYSYGKLNYSKMFERIDSYIDKGNILIERYDSESKTLDSELNTIHKKYVQSEENVHTFRKLSDKLDNSLKNLKDNIEKLFIEDNRLEKFNKQFFNLINETQENSQNLNSQFDVLFTLKNNVEGFINKTDHGLLGEADFDKSKTDLKTLKKSGKQLELLIRNNNTECENAIKNIKASISEIKYYEYFEQVIQEIISELNSVNYKLKVNKELDSISKEENLEKIKEYYTMQTEHNIHDKVAKGDEEIDFDINEDDDIEFF